MEDLLVALGWKMTLFQRLRLISLFVTVTLGILIIDHILFVLFQWNFLLIHAAGWALWFSWQGWLFPRNRERYIHSAPTTSYRRAFYRDILFGVSFGVAQM